MEEIFPLLYNSLKNPHSFCIQILLAFFLSHSLSCTPPPYLILLIFFRVGAGYKMLLSEFHQQQCVEDNLFFIISTSILKFDILPQLIMGAGETSAGYMSKTNTWACSW